jgi:predicted RND superfamily exporter protein
VALRSVRLGLVAVLPNLLPFALTLAVMVWCGIKLRPLSVITFCIAFGLAVDNTTHLLARYREARRRGVGRELAIAESLTCAGEPVLVTNLLLIVGFATIFTSEFKGTFEFGLLVLPALLRVLAPERPRGA